MPNIITAERTYATPANAERALDAALARIGKNRTNVRWLIGVSASDSTRFVPTLVGQEYIAFAQVGIMVIG